MLPLSLLVLLLAATPLDARTEPESVLDRLTSTQQILPQTSSSAEPQLRPARAETRHARPPTRPRCPSTGD